MKKIGRITAAVLATLLYAPEAYTQKEVAGSGYVLTQQRQTPGFTGIEVSQGIKVFMAQGEAKPITVEADDNLFPYLKTVVEQNVLRIFIPDSIRIRKYADLNVLVSLPRLTQLTAATAAKIDANITVWSADQVTVQADHSAEIKLHANSQKIIVNASGSGYVELRGGCTTLDANLQSGATLKAKALKAAVANIRASQGATAEITVSDTVGYNLSDGAKLIYKGQPALTQTRTATGAKVVKEK